MLNKISTAMPTQQKYSTLKTKGRGFTIIELVLVIVLMGILAVTVAPKMFNSDGFQEYAYQAEVITTLRNIQLKAMQQTDGNTCHTVTISKKLLSITSLCSTASQSEINNEKNNQYVPQVLITETDSVEFKTSGSASTQFSFNSLGKPINCSNPCEIVLLGADTLIIKIESEGFIHAL